MIHIHRQKDVFRHPEIQDPPVEVAWTPWWTVRQYLPEDFNLNGINLVALNGRPLTGEEVDGLRLKDGDRIALVDVPGVFGVLAASATVGVQILAAVADVVLVSAISIGVGFGVQALLGPTKLPRYNQPDGPARNFDGIQDTSGAGRPVPFIYGRVRTGGHFLQSFEREPSDETASPGTTHLWTLLGVCHGPVEAVSGIQINGQALETFNEGTPDGEPEPIRYWTRLGEADQATIPGFGSEITHEVTHARSIRYDDAAPQHFVTTTEIDAFEITWRFPNGLFQSKDTGQSQPYTVQFLVEWRPHGSGQDWDANLIKTCSAMKLGPYKDQLRVDGLQRAKYEIRIKRETLDDDYWQRPLHTSISEVYAISEIEYAHRAHPGMAMVGFRQIPSPQLNGAVPTTYTFLVDGFNDIRIYSDTSNYSTGWSENPAWCCAHFICQETVGLGDRYTYDNIDIQSFLDWAAYCDELVPDGQGGEEKRATLGHVFDEYTSAQDVLEVFTQGSGARLVLWGDKWRVVLDEPSEMVWVGTEANIAPGSFKHQWVDDRSRANRIHGVFADAENDYQRESTQMETPDIEQGDLYVEASREFWGVTRRSQVERELYRLLLHNKYEDEKVTLKAGLDSLQVTVGSVFGVGMPQMATVLSTGQIWRAPGAGAASHFWIDGDVTLEAGETYEVTVLHQDGGKITTKRVINNPETTDHIYCEDAAWTGTLQPGDRYSIGKTSIVKFRAISTSLEADFGREIVGLKYDPTVYEWDLTLPPSPVLPSIPDPRQLPPDPSGLVLYEHQEFAQDGSLISVVDVDWEAPASAVLDHFEVWWRLYGESGWVLEGSTRQSHFEIKPAQSPGVTYQVAVVSVSSAGAKKSPNQVPSRTLTTTGLLTQPSNLSGLQAHLIDGTLVATCNPAPDGELGPAGYYEWRRGTSWAKSSLLDKTSSPRLELTSYARGTTYILVKAVNSVGNKSPEAASVSITLYGQIDENIILEQSEEPGWSGTMVGLQEVDDELTLYEPTTTTIFVPANPIPTRGAKFLSFGYPDAVQTVVLEGYYTTGAINVSSGQVVRARADVAVEFTPIDIGLGTFDAATWSFDDDRADVPFSGAEGDDMVAVTVESRVSTTDTSEGSWSTWAEHRDRAELEMKYIQFRLHVQVYSDAYSVTIESMKISIDLPEKYYAGVHTQASATSFDVDYPTSYFTDVKRLLVSVIGGAAGDTVRVTAQDETGFTGEIRDSGGSLTTGNVHYEALGY